MSVSETSKSTSFTLQTRVKEAVESVGHRLEHTSERLNAWAADNAVGRWFKFKERNAKLTVECRAGFITFLMVSYVLAVQPNILITTGGTCDPKVVCDPTNYDMLGAACLGDADDVEVHNCLEQLKTNLITATAASSLISTFVMGLMANLPLALAPGVGITAYVAYQVVGQYGQGQLTYQQAMAAIFIEGWIFLALSLTGVRGGLVKYMPKSIAMASSVGIGLLLAFTGLTNLGVIAFNGNTFVGLGGCDQSSQTFVYAFNKPLNYTQLLANSTGTTLLPVPAAVHGCSGATMRSSTMWLGMGGGVLMAVLLFAGVKGSLVIGILFVTVISWIPGHSASYLGAGSAVAGGEYRMQTFKKVVAAPSLNLTGFAWDWSAFSNGQLWLALFTFLYIDLLDCTGTLLSMARLLDHVMPGFCSEELEFPGQMWAFLSDGTGILAGSMMGSTPLTVYIESAAGIEDGGRTGLTAMVVSFFFMVSLFFSPILASIPPYATGPALVLVGSLLLGHTAHIPWEDVGQAIPAFLTIIIMPFTYSVAYGVIAGLAAYIGIHLPFWLWDLLRQQLWKRNKAGIEQRSAAVSRARVHRKVFLGGNVSNAGGSMHGSDGYDLSYQSSYANTRRPGIAGLLKSSGGTMPRADSLPALDNFRAGGALPIFRRSMTSLPPGPRIGNPGPGSGLDSAWGSDSRITSLPPSGQSSLAQEVERRTSASWHQGSAYHDYVAAAGPDRSIQGGGQGSPGGAVAAGLEPRPTYYNRSSSNGSEPSRHTARSGSPALKFSGGTFRLTSGSSEEKLPVGFGASRGGIQRSATLPAERPSQLFCSALEQRGGEPSDRSVRGLRMFAKPETQGQDGAGERVFPSTGGFKLFGEVDLPEEEAEVVRVGNSFKLFGDVELPEEAGKGPPPSDTASPFKLFGDVELPEEPADEAGGGAGGGTSPYPSSRSFELLGDAQLPEEGGALQ